MAGVFKERLLRGDDADAKTNLDALLRDYNMATEDFAQGLRQSLSNYDLMVAIQKYLLAAAAAIKGISEIFDNQNLYPATSFFEAVAWAYLDNSDLRAYQQGLDDRFTLSEDNSRFLRSRLKSKAERAKRIGEIYSKELRDATGSERSALKFLLELVLELPIGAWECAPCLSMNGNCRDCGYGRDHGICTHPGSTYEMLSSSRDAIIKRIRRNLTKTGRRLGDGVMLQEHNTYPDFSDKSPFSQMITDICGEYDIVELCD